MHSLWGGVGILSKFPPGEPLDQMKGRFLSKELTFLPRNRNLLQRVSRYQTPNYEDYPIIRATGQLVGPGQTAGPEGAG